MPENLRPIFEARTAHDAVRATTALLNSSSPEDQSRLLHGPIFINIVNSVLMGLDECRRDHALEIVGTFDKDIRAEAHALLINELN